MIGDVSRDPCDRGRFQHRGDRKADSEVALDPREHLDSQQRVASDVEEVVLHADPIDAEQVDPDLEHALFQDVARRHERPAQSHDVWSGGQRAAVWLAVRQSRDVGCAADLCR